MEAITRVIPMDLSMIEDAVDLFMETFSKEPWNDVYESKDQVKRFFENHFKNNYFMGYVLMHEENMCGICLGMKKPWIHGLEYYIDEYCIHYAHQGKGLGSIFLKGIEEDIKQSGLNGIILNTEKTMPSYDFYVKNGFKELDGLIVLGK